MAHSQITVDWSSLFQMAQYTQLKAKVIKSYVIMKSTQKTHLAELDYWIEGKKYYILKSEEKSIKKKKPHTACVGFCHEKACLYTLHNHC